MSKKKKYHFKMDRKDGEKWISALRSGNYKQCQATLVGFKESDDMDYTDENEVNKLDVEGYCCLGVFGKEVIGLSNFDMCGSDLLSNIKKQTCKVSNELSKPKHSDLESILASLNDGFYLRNYRNYTSDYPHLNFLFTDKEREAIEKDESMESDLVIFAKRDFNQIADFIEENIEFV